MLHTDSNPDDESEFRGMHSCLMRSSESEPSVKALVWAENSKLRNVMSTTQKRILSIEDHAEMSRLIAVILRGYTVISATSKADALRLVASEKFDLILSDYHLPDGTGFEVCLFIRTFDKTTPIIFATSDDSITEAEVLTLGAQAIVWKGPTFVEKLKDAVQKYAPRP